MKIDKKHITIYEVVEYCTFVTSVDDLFKNIDLIIDLAKNDVQVVAQSKGIFFSDFEYYYKTASYTLKIQLQKEYLKGIIKLKQGENIENAIKWIVSRILNNMRNISTNPKYKKYVEVKFEYDYAENIVLNNYDELEFMLEMEDLKRVDQNTLINGLKQVWHDSKYDIGFDYEDFKDLCKKYNMEVNDVVKIENLEQQKFLREQAGSCNYQLVFSF